MRDPEAPLLLRLAVVVGGVTLVFGVVGAVLLLVRGDDEGPAYGPGLGPRLLVLGAPDDADLTVDLSWATGEMVEHSAALNLGTTGVTFLLPPNAAGRVVTLEIRNRADGGAVLYHRELEVMRGEEIVVDLLESEETEEPGADGR